jgi:hypothetical protein
VTQGTVFFFGEMCIRGSGLRGSDLREYGSRGNVIRENGPLGNDHTGKRIKSIFYLILLKKARGLDE